MWALAFGYAPASRNCISAPSRLSRYADDPARRRTADWRQGADQRTRAALNRLFGPVQQEAAFSRAALAASLAQDCRAKIDRRDRAEKCETVATHVRVDGLGYRRPDAPTVPSAVSGRAPLRGHAPLTSRFSDWSAFADEVSLDVLPLEEAVACLETRTGRHDTEGARALAEALGCLPLALDHAAAYCKRTQMSFVDYGASRRTKI